MSPELSEYAPQLAIVVIAISILLKLTHWCCFSKKKKPTARPSITATNSSVSESAQSINIFNLETVIVQHNCVHFSVTPTNPANSSGREYKLKLTIKNLTSGATVDEDVTNQVRGRHIVTISGLTPNTLHEVTLDVYDDKENFVHEVNESFTTTNVYEEELLAECQLACSDPSAISKLRSRLIVLIQSTQHMVDSFKRKLNQDVHVMVRGKVGSGKSNLLSNILSLFTEWNSITFPFGYDNMDGTEKDRIESIIDGLLVKDQVGELQLTEAAAGSRYNVDNSDVKSFSELRWLHNGNYIKVDPQPAEHAGKQGSVALIVLSAKHLNEATIQLAREWKNRLKGIPVLIVVTMIDVLPSLEVMKGSTTVPPMASFLGSNVMNQLKEQLGMKNYNIHFVSCIANQQEFDMENCSQLQKVNIMLKKILILQVVEKMMKLLCSNHSIKVTQLSPREIILDATPKQKSDNKSSNSETTATTIAPTRRNKARC